MTVYVEDALKTTAEYASYWTKKTQGSTSAKDRTTCRQAFAIARAYALNGLRLIRFMRSGPHHGRSKEFAARAAVVSLGAAERFRLMGEMCWRGDLNRDSIENLKHEVIVAGKFWTKRNG